MRWIKHDGKGAPASLDGWVMVEVKYRDGKHGQSEVQMLDDKSQDGSLWWNSSECPEDDIVEYRVVSP